MISAINIFETGFKRLLFTVLAKTKSYKQRGLRLPRKRLPIAFGIFTMGIGIASAAVSVMGTPVVQTNYLHEHLTSLKAEAQIEWADMGDYLTNEDKTNIGEIILESEKINFEKNYTPQPNNQVLNNQGLEARLKGPCTSREDSCIFPLRLNRKLTAAHVNQDFRVANIDETSLRINLQVLPNTDDLALIDMTEEVRVLRFYQSQLGWIHNNAQIIKKIPQSHADRDGKFNTEFSDKLIGLNYYPASASWRDFWVDFPLADIRSDLNLARQLNVNAVRIFLNHDYFDGEDTAIDAREKLKTFLDLCRAENIQVLITLFDLRPNYALSNWSTDIKHIDAIFSTLGDHAAILGVDLKNQPDLDFDDWGQGRVDAWLTVMARHMQTHYPDLAVTAGWSTAQHALRLSGVFDIITYHEYQEPKGFADRLNQITAKANGKPVMITEMGTTIWKPPFIERMGESAQAKRLGNQLKQSNKAHGVFIWTLHDFDHIGRAVVGPLPWRQAQQRRFGIIRKDGVLRPAGMILKKYGANVNAVNSLPPSSNLNLTDKTKP